MNKEEFIEKLSNTRNTYKGATDGKSLRMENIAVKALVSQFGIKESYEAVEGDEELAKYLSNFVSSSAFADDTPKESNPVEDNKEEEVTETKTDIENVQPKVEDEDEETPLDKLFIAFKKKHKEAQMKRSKIVFSGYKFYYNDEGKFVLEDSATNEKIPFNENPTVADVLAFFSPKDVKREPTTERTDEESPLEKSRKEVLKLLEEEKVGNMALIDAMVKKDKRKAKEFLQSMTDGKISQDEFLDEVRNICEGRYDADKTDKKKEEEVELVSPYEFPKFLTVGQLIEDKIEVDGKLIDAVPFLAQWLLAFEPRVSSDLVKMGSGEIDVYDMYQPYTEGEFPTEKDLDVSTLHNDRYFAEKISKVCRYIIGFAPQDVVYISGTGLREGDTIHVVGVCEDLKKSKPTAVITDPTDTGILHTERYRFIFKTDIWFKHIDPEKSSK